MISRYSIPSGGEHVSIYVWVDIKFKLSYLIIKSLYYYNYQPVFANQNKD